MGPMTYVTTQRDSVSWEASLSVWKCLKKRDNRCKKELIVSKIYLIDIENITASFHGRTNINLIFYFYLFRVFNILRFHQTIRIAGWLAIYFILFWILFYFFTILSMRACFNIDGTQLWLSGQSQNIASLRNIFYRYRKLKNVFPRHNK